MKYLIELVEAIFYGIGQAFAIAVNAMDKGYDDAKKGRKRIK